MMCLCLQCLGKEGYTAGVSPPTKNPHISLLYENKKTGKL